MLQVSCMDSTRTRPKPVQLSKAQRQVLQALPFSDQTVVPRKVVPNFVVNSIFSFAAALVCVSPAQAQCSWAEMAVEGIAAKLDETPCEALLKWEQTRKELALTTRRELALVHDPEVESLLQSFVSQMQQILAEHYGKQPTYKVFLVDDPNLQASATGPDILVHYGTVAFYLNPLAFWKMQGYTDREARDLVRRLTPWDQDVAALSFILAHETAHNVLGHPSSILALYCNSYVEHRRTELEKQTNRAQAGKKPSAWSKFGDAMKLGLSGVLNSVAYRQYSQMQEQEADELAIFVLVKADLDVSAGPRALSHLALLYGVSETASQTVQEIMCSTHPEAVSRIENAEKFVSQLQQEGEVELPGPVDVSDVRQAYLELKSLTQKKPSAAEETSPQAK